ncbi:MAG: hypothetical protein IJG33_03135 [Selenomonadaceae bacterium]|nr:hypothetical protein [Selenomonadaceae bacterium]
MATTIKGLKTALKKANKRVDKAFARYEKSTSKLYFCDYAGRVRKLKDEVFRPDGSIRTFATDITGEMLKRDRGGWHGRVTLSYDLDALPILRKLETELDAAVNEREDLLWQLEDLGVDVYKDAELWQ